MLVAAFLLVLSELCEVVGCKGSEERSRSKIKSQNTSKGNTWQEGGEAGMVDRRHKILPKKCILYN